MGIVVIQPVSEKAEAANIPVAMVIFIFFIFYLLFVGLFLFLGKFG